MNIAFQKLATINITTEEERNEVASDLVILTSNSFDLSEDDIKNAITTVKSIVSTKKLDQNVIKIKRNLFMKYFIQKLYYTSISFSNR